MTKDKSKTLKPLQSEISSQLKLAKLALNKPKTSKVAIYQDFMGRREKAKDNNHRP